MNIKNLVWIFTLLLLVATAQARVLCYVTENGEPATENKYFSDFITNNQIENFTIKSVDADNTNWTSYNTLCDVFYVGGNFSSATSTNLAGINESTVGIVVADRDFDDIIPICTVADNYAGTTSEFFNTTTNAIFNTTNSINSGSNTLYTSFKDFAGCQQMSAPRNLAASKNDPTSEYSFIPIEQGTALSTGTTTLARWVHLGLEDGNGLSYTQLAKNITAHAIVWAAQDSDVLSIPVDDRPDLVITGIKYNIINHINFTPINNTMIEGDNMQINITIHNNGTNNSGTFRYSFTLDGITVLNTTTSLSGGAFSTIKYNWTTKEGFHKGVFSLDEDNTVNETYETNNQRNIYIPFMINFALYNQTELISTILPFSSDSTNTVAYDSYSWAKSFTSEGFTATLGNTVDPRGKKAFENAVGCMLNDFNMSLTTCKNAINHTIGWANLPASSYNNVQQIHQVIWLGLTLDVMKQNLNKTTLKNVSAGYYKITQAIADLPNVDLENLDTDEIQGGNGKGFGQGMAGLALFTLGLYPDNPTYLSDNHASWGSSFSIIDQWNYREDLLLAARKNDSYSQYQEGYLYKYYTEQHLPFTLGFRIKYDIGNPLRWQNAIDAMGTEFLYILLDDTYNGATHRGDENRYWRGIQRGDSNSYEDIGSDSNLKYSYLSFWAYYHSNETIAKSLLYLRELMHNTTGTEGENGHLEMFVQPLSYGKLSNTLNPEGLLPYSVFDNANDIFTIRKGFSFNNDTVIQIDGGEERGGGHSQAQGYYIYAFGEPFLDYEQVPQEDDVRMSTWKNGISFGNTSVLDDGINGQYLDTCGAFDEGNQYYGMSSCATASYSTDYPDYRRFPVTYGGDLYDYIGSSDGNFAGVRVKRPYNGSVVSEYFISYNDLLTKRTVTAGNSGSGGTYHNFIGIAGEFDETEDVLNFTLNRSNKYLSTYMIYRNTSLDLNGGITEVNLSYNKTGGTSESLEYRRKYYYAGNNDLDMIFAHHWYLTGKESKPIKISANDRGLEQDGAIIVFDTNNDGNTTYNSNWTDGWGFVIDSTNNIIAGFNATKVVYNNSILLTSQQPVEFYCDISSPTQSICNFNTQNATGGYDTFDSFDVTVRNGTQTIQGGQIPVSYTLTVNLNESGSTPPTPTNSSFSGASAPACNSAVSAILNFSSLLPILGTILIASIILGATLYLKREQEYNLESGFAVFFMITMIIIGIILTIGIEVLSSTC